jgi:hypothetical protein
LVAGGGLELNRTSLATPVLFFYFAHSLGVELEYEEAFVYKKMRSPNTDQGILPFDGFPSLFLQVSVR